MSDATSGAFLSDAIGAIVGLAALATALVAATWRYTAVLRRLSEEEVERATAIGFFFGLGASAAILVIDQVRG